MEDPPGAVPPRPGEASREGLHRYQHVDSSDAGPSPRRAAAPIERTDLARAAVPLPQPRIATAPRVGVSSTRQQAAADPAPAAAMHGAGANAPNDEAEARTPDVAFRTAAELRKLIQEGRVFPSSSSRAEPPASTSPASGGATANRPAGTGRGTSSSIAPPPIRPLHSAPGSAGSRSGHDRADADPGVTTRHGGAGSRTTGAAGRSEGGTVGTRSGKPGSSLSGPLSRAASTDPDQKAKTYALTLLKRGTMSAADLAGRLAARGHEARVVSELVAWLEGEGLLNDALYAKLYARSKWEGSLSAPAKIRRDLVGHGVAAEHIEEALAAVFGPSCRIRLTGRVSTVETEVREALLAAARRHVDQRRGSYAASAAADPRGSGGNREDWAAAARAQAKDREGKRRRLGMWLQYRGHDMDLILKVFNLLGI